MGTIILGVVFDVTNRSRRRCFDRCSTVSIRIARRCVSEATNLRTYISLGSNPRKSGLRVLLLYPYFQSDAYSDLKALHVDYCDRLHGYGHDVESFLRYGQSAIKAARILSTASGG